MQYCTTIKNVISTNVRYNPTHKNASLQNQFVSLHFCFASSSVNIALLQNFWYSCTNNWKRCTAYGTTVRVTSKFVHSCVQTNVKLVQATALWVALYHYWYNLTLVAKNLQNSLVNLQNSLASAYNNVETPTAIDLHCHSPPLLMYNIWKFYKKITSSFA
jgi:hypothetical protein